MDISIKIFEVALPILYFSIIWVYGKSFFKGTKWSEILKTPLLIITLISHCWYIVTRTLVYGHPPITTMFEILSLIAFTITLAYAYIELRTKNRSTGYFILNLPFFFQLTSSSFIKGTTDVPAILQSNLLGFHVSSALLGYAAITISAVYGFLYLMLYHEIKSSRFGVIYERLPNLETLERMSFTSTVFAFIFLTIAITIGLIWLPRAVADFSYVDPKLIGTVAIWLIYGVSLTVKKMRRWQGRKIILLSIFGFIIAMFSMGVINIFFSGFHKFY